MGPVHGGHQMSPKIFITSMFKLKEFLLMTPTNDGFGQANNGFPSSRRVRSVGLLQTASANP